MGAAFWYTNVESRATREIAGHGPASYGRSTMGQSSVAVLDIRSSEITVIVGARGVNNTFVFNASHTEPYTGYEQGAFYDTANLSEAIVRAVTEVEKAMNERIRTLYVGVPGEFTRVVPKERNAGYSKKRKITERDTDALFESGKEELEGYRLIRNTSMIYVTGDNRRTVDPVGISTTSLYGLLAYYYCKNYFCETLERIFKKMKIELCYLPAELAMATYLIPDETRDEYAILLDTGFLSSTISVAVGGGTLKEQTSWVGKGQIAFRVMKAFGLPYDVALALLQKANLYSKGGGKTEFLFRGKSYEIDPAELASVVKDGLDEICEAIAGFLDDCSGRELDFKPLYVTGEGITEIRGALEHISKRVSRVCELLVPDLPYYNKPAMSSRISLVAMAYDDHRKRGFFRRLFKTFGG